MFVKIYIRLIFSAIHQSVMVPSEGIIFTLI